MSANFLSVVSHFVQPALATETMRDFATRCDRRRRGRCKSCAFLLKALDEIDLLKSKLVSAEARVTTNAEPVRLPQEGGPGSINLTLPGGATLAADVVRWGCAVDFDRDRLDFDHRSDVLLAYGRGYHRQRITLTFEVNAHSDLRFMVPDSSDR